ncbi:hypothetical protein MMC07_002138 [Pseudocyphellaria aurata]|nr:hypothetical protein [Pseudocyphellaria aurata]
MTPSVMRALQSEERTKDLEKTLQQPAFALEQKDWTSPTDPENAQNWPLSIKIYHTMIAAAFGFLITFSATVYVPGVQSVAHEFRVSNVAAVVPFSLFVLGYAFGPVIAAPCSETFGRRLVYWTSIPFLALFLLASGLSQNLASLTIYRFLAGLFGSPGLSIGSGSVADIWKPEERTIPMAAFVAAPFLGPSMGAIIGAFVVQGSGWRWTQWIAVFLAVVVYFPSFFIRETYKKTILSRRAHKMTLAPRSITQRLSRPSIQTARYFVTVTLTRPIHMLFTEPIVGLLSLYVAFTFAVVYAFYPAIPQIFAQVYGFSTTSQGLVFLGLTVGYTAAVATIIFTARVQKKHRRNIASNKEGGNAMVVPEKSLLLAMMGGPVLPVALLLFGWSAKPTIHWIVPMIGITMYGWGTLLVFVSSLISSCLPFILEFHQQDGNMNNC